MSFAIAAGAVVGLGGAYLSAQGAKSAGRAQAGAADAATAEQQRQYDLYREDQAPYREIGTGALNQLAKLYGIKQYSGPPAQQQQPLSFGDWQAQNPASQIGMGGNLNNLVAANGNAAEQYQQYVNEFNAQQAQNAPEDDGSAPDYSAFYNSPDYKFALDQGNQSLQRAAAAGGRLASGNTLAAAQQYGQGLATQNYGNYVNRLAGIAGIGQSATNATGAAGITTGQGVADSLVGAGAARASGIAGQYNAYGDALGTVGNAFNTWMQGRKSPGGGSLVVGN